MEYNDILKMLDVSTEDDSAFLQIFMYTFWWYGGHNNIKSLPDNLQTLSCYHKSISNLRSIVILP